MYVHPAELPLAVGTYLPEYANPLDRWVIAPLLHVLSRRAVASMLAQTSLEGVARSMTTVATAPQLRAFADKQDVRRRYGSSP